MGLQFLNSRVKKRDQIVAIDLGSRTTKAVHLHRQAISSLEAELDPRAFARIDRSAIVNLARVRELQPMFGGEYVIILSTGTKLTLSRGYRDAFRDRLGSEI